MGGLASGEARREKSAMRDVSAMVLGIKRSVSEKTIEQLKEMGISRDEITTQVLALVKQGEKAIAGDLNALMFLRDTAGEKPSDKLSLQQQYTGDFEIVIGPPDGYRDDE